MKLLLENNADIDTQDEFGIKPIHYAIYKGHENITKILLENGTDIESKTKYETTPLMMTAIKGCTSK